MSSDSEVSTSRPESAATPPPVAKKPRIQLNTLTGTRGVLSISVFLGHASIEPVYRHVAINHDALRLTSGIGEAAVSYFFMLSGFVLVWASRPGDTPRAFWRRRFFKIFPNHLTTWTIGLILMVVAGEWAGWFNVLPSLPLLQVWIPVESVLAGTDGPAWSLSCEIFFYALFPLLLAWVNRMQDDKKLWRWLYIAGGTIIAFTVIVGLTVPSQPQALGQPVSLYQFYILIFIPPLRLVDFVLGMLLCRLVIRKQWPNVSWTWVLGTFFVGWVLSWTLPAPLGFVAPMVIPNVLLIGKAAMNDIHNIPSFLTRRTVVWLGDVSFAFYLTHWLVLHYGRVFLGGGPWSTPVATAFLVGALALAITLAEGLRRGVELPAMKRWSRARVTAGAVAGAATTSASTSTVTGID